MATLANLIARTRLELGDTGESFHATAQGDGETQRFDLPHSPISRTGLTVTTVTQTGTITTLVEGTHFDLDPEAGALTLYSPLADGVVLTVQGTTFKYFSDEDITLFVTEAFDKHNVRRYPPIAFDPVPIDGTAVAVGPIETQAIAILAAIEALWVLTTDAADDIDVLTPEGVSIPRTQRYAQLVNQRRELEMRYQEIASAMNIGLNRIEMFTLRRVSRTFNKLVPIFVPQELEDRTRPVRIYPPIDRGA